MLVICNKTFSQLHEGSYPDDKPCFPGDQHARVMIPEQGGNMAAVKAALSWFEMVSEAQDGSNE